MSVDGSTRSGPGPRAGDGRGSPSPSLTSEKTLTEAEIAVTKIKMQIIEWLSEFQEKQETEEDERKARLQLYVFVLRSIAYPFNAKQPNDMIKRHHKVTKEGLERIRNKVDVRGDHLSEAVIHVYF